MKIASDDVPQADTLSDVVATVEAVDQGAITFHDIASHIGKVDRQGRYYRRAAEILGFVQNEHNHSRLTQLGRIFLDGTAVEKQEMLARAMLSSRIMLRVIPFFEGHPGGVSRESLQAFISQVTDTTANMIQRRTVTILRWLETIGVIQERGNLYFLTAIPANIQLLEFDADDEPLFPRSYTLEDYENITTRIRNRVGKVARYVDEAKLERANNTHRHLVNLMADRIKAAQSIPKQNRLIDLSANINREVFLFEMKSTTEDNVRDQIRKGISQLYEYRYIQDVSANLVLVLDNHPAREEAWLVDYLLNDRNILVVWDGDDRFDCPESLRDRLPFIFRQ